MTLWSDYSGPPSLYSPLTLSEEPSGRVVGNDVGLAAPLIEFPLSDVSLNATQTVH